MSLSYELSFIIFVYDVVKPITYTQETTSQCSRPNLSTTGYVIFSDGLRPRF